MISSKTFKFFKSGLVCLLILAPQLVLAQTGFDSKVSGITNMIVAKILPAVAGFGLVYAAILAAVGDESSKRRIVLVVVASIVGILAKFVVPLFQSGM